MRRRQHVNSLAYEFEILHGQKPTLETNRRLEIEIGCADAQFLFERAEQCPNNQYVGFEVRKSLVDEVNARAKGKYPVQAVFCNANHHLRKMLPQNAAAVAYLNFPDPWFKRRHHKRRVITQELGEDLHGVLAPQGEVLIQTDIWALAIEAMEVFERLDSLYTNCLTPWTFWKQAHPYGARSWREAYCERNQRKIWRIRYNAMK